jgi:hypothetical protein
MRTSDAINELAAALAAAQGEMSNAAFNADNPAFKGTRYANLAAIRDATIPHLSKHGLALLQTTDVNTTEMLLTTRLLHSSGQWVESIYPIPVSDRPHIMGSAITYAKRYSWAAICGVASDKDDDDGNAAQDAAAKNGNALPALPQKRTRQEISDDANRKRQQVRDVDADIHQIDNLAALDRYEREILTPEFMAGLGMKQWAVEQKVGERRRELEAENDAPYIEPGEDAEDLSPDQRLAWEECKGYLAGATTVTDLVKRATKNEGYKNALPRLTEKQREALRAYYKQRLGEFGRAEVAQ